MTVLDSLLDRFGRCLAPQMVRKPPAEAIEQAIENRHAVALRKAA